MAYIVGYVTKEEKARLEKRGWEVEPAEEYGLVGPDPSKMLSGPEGDNEAVVIFVDSDVLTIMSGPDWEQGLDGCTGEEYLDALECGGVPNPIHVPKGK
jgi:hypothetical protein